jgi:hypothetical protein
VVVENSRSRLVQALHYDFVEPGQGGHPFFHAQLTNEAIPDADLRSVDCQLELELQADSDDCVVTTRIPTPDMTLASVLYCLVADHLDATRFAEFAGRVHAIQNRLPAPGFESIRRSLEGATHFKSSHWFAHGWPN